MGESTFDTSKTCRSGSNAALIIRQYGAILIRQAIIRKSMVTSSGIEQGQRKLLFDLKSEKCEETHIILSEKCVDLIKNL